MSVVEQFDKMSYSVATEGPEVANDWLEKHGRKFGCVVDNEPTSAEGLFEVFNPATGEVIANVSQASKSTVDKAIKSARKAMPAWQALGGFGRAKVLYAIARAIQKNSRLFAVLESLDNGKPIRESRDIDIPLVARHFYHHAGWAQESFPGFEAVGVCGAIIPWNFPLLMLAWKVAPALAMGNTVVLKPAEYTPLTALLFAEIAKEAGLPAGVLNIVTGDGEVGEMLVKHPGIDKIAFTGSTEVGKAIRKETAGSGKKLTLELGGKSPYIVFEDADIDSAIEGLVEAIWFNQGQVCCAGSRLLIQESIETKFIARLKERMSKLRIGNPLDKSVDIGAIVAPVQVQRIHSMVKQGVDEGAGLFQAGTLPECGWFYPATLLTDVSPASAVVQEEIFGPVLVAIPFRTHKEAIELANNTNYGLAASIWTENLSLAHHVAASVKAGTVWINCTNQFDASSGFGGYRESGYGREGGKEGLYAYLKEVPGSPRPTEPEATETASIDRTHKLYIGGKQVRPDSGYSLTINGEEFPCGSKKDVRNAVEAAEKALPSWSGSTAFLRSQILYFLAENLAANGASNAVTEPLFALAGMTDKLDGSVHQVPGRMLNYTRNEPLGKIGIIAPKSGDLSGLVTAISAAIAMGNTVVVIASESNPKPAAELYRVLDTSDIPAGVVNILTGRLDEMAKTLCEHDAIDAIWNFAAESKDVEAWSIGNLKQTWSPADSATVALKSYLWHAVQVKNVWAPYGA